MSKRALLAGFALLAASSARAASFPTRGGETGLLDVPNAEVALPGGGLIGAEFGLAQSSGRPVDLGPLPLSLVTGLGRGLEIGFSMREGGRPGDPAPPPPSSPARSSTACSRPTASRRRWRSTSTSIGSTGRGSRAPEPSPLQHG